MASVVEFKIAENNVDLVKAASDDAIRTALELVGQLAEGYAIEELSKIKPHKTQPTMRPNVDTGRLRNSIKHQVESDGKAVIVGTNVEYAPYLELGTSRMPKGFPFLKPAVTEHTDTYNEAIEKVLKG